MSVGKGITPEQATHAVGVLRTVINRWCGGSQTAAQELLGVSQAHLSLLLKGEKGGPGLGVILRIRDLTGLSVEQILGLPPPRCHAGYLETSGATERTSKGKMVAMTSQVGPPLAIDTTPARGPEEAGFISEKLGGRVAEALRRSGKRKTHVEKEAQLPSGYMTRLIKGERKRIGAEMLHRLAKALDCNYEWLCFGHHHRLGGTHVYSTPGRVVHAVAQADLEGQ